MPCPANELGAIVPLGAAWEATGFCSAGLRLAFWTLPFDFEFAPAGTKFKGAAGETPAVRKATSFRLGCMMAQACCSRVRARRAVPLLKKRQTRKERSRAASQASAIVLHVTCGTGRIGCATERQMRRRDAGGTEVPPRPERALDLGRFVA